MKTEWMERMEEGWRVMEVGRRKVNGGEMMGRWTIEGENRRWEWGYRMGESP